MDNVVYRADNLTFTYGGDRGKEPIFEGLSFEVARGKITTLLGANGSGKSTLFRLLTKNLRPTSGSIELDGQPLADYRLNRLARQVAVVWQHNIAPYDITVRQLVAYGRIPHRQHMFAQESAEDKEAIANALDICDLSDFTEQRVSELSGGQQQRVWIALGLAQQTPVMFLDEPTTFLDVQYQLMILQLIRRLNRELSMTVVLILHDINQALSISDEIIALRSGGGEAVTGSPQLLVDEDFLHEIYHADLKVVRADEKRLIYAEV